MANKVSAETIPILLRMVTSVANDAIVPATNATNACLDNLTDPTEYIYSIVI
jgi:hypothetical protein